MLKNIKKWAIALVLVLSLFLLVGCGDTTNCPECKDPTKEECNDLYPAEECKDWTKEECNAKYPAEECPECPAPKDWTEEECNAKYPPEECKQDFVAPTSIILFGDDVKVGENLDLAKDAEIAPATANKTFIWTSSDPSIATVDANGVVTGVRPGAVEITATSVLKNTVTTTTEVTVSETNSAYDIATREVAYIAEQLSGYVTGDFDLPKPWNGFVEVTYDVDGEAITEFKMPEMGEATSMSYTINYTVVFEDTTLANTINLKLVKEVEGEDNDFEKVDLAIKAINKLFINYVAGIGEDKISEDIQLPKTWDGVAYNWSTNKSYVLTNDGEYIRPDNDTTVTYTVSPKAGAAAKSATITFNIKGYTADEKFEYQLNEGVLANIAGKTFDTSFLLPTSDDEFGISFQYTVSSPLTIAAIEGGNGEYVKVVNAASADSTATIKVTARYEAADGFQFFNNYEFKVNVKAVNAAAEAIFTSTDIVTLQGAAKQVKDLQNVLWMPYGLTGEDNVIVLPATIGGTAVTWTADDNFEQVDAITFKLVTQYFRYHEAKIVAEIAGSEIEFAINVGLAEKPLTYYHGGRTQSYQASSLPQERGDGLQTFSFWDKYVGIVSSAGERTNQYWSEFSGYTFYVDETNLVVNTNLAKDADGVITVTPSFGNKTIRHQMFVMQFGVNRIYYAKAFGSNFYPLVDSRFVRATYGGNFAHFVVNETDKALDIPVSTLSMGGYFADGETSMYTFSLTKLMNGKTEMLDSDKLSYKVSREQSLAYDGYRPGFSLTGGTAVLAEGQSVTLGYVGGSAIDLVKVGTEYKKVSTRNCQYIQYKILPTKSAVWGGPFLQVGAYSFAYQFHSQDYYSLSNPTVIALCGGVADTSKPVYAADTTTVIGYEPAPITVQRFTRHVNNEEITDKFVNAVYALSTDYSDVSKAQVAAYEAVYARTDGTAKDAYGNSYKDAPWVDSWKNKTTKYGEHSPKEALAELAKIKAATDAAAAKQLQYAESVHDKIDALVALYDAAATDAAKIAALKSKEATTLISDADTLYAALTPGRLSFIDSTTYKKLTSLKVELQIDAISDGIKANKDQIVAAADAINAAKAALGNTVEGCITQYAEDKVAGLVLALQVINMPDGSKTADKKAILAANTALTAAQAANTTDANEPYDWVYGTAAAEILAARGKLAEAYKADAVAQVAILRDAFTVLLEDNTVDEENLTAAQLKTLKDALAAAKALHTDYQELTSEATLGAKVVTLYQEITLLVPTVVTVPTDFAEFKLFIERDFVKSTLKDGKIQIDTAYAALSEKDDKGGITDLEDMLDAHYLARIEEVEDQIDELPSVKTLTLEDEALVAAARAAVKALSIPSGYAIDPTALADLAELETALADKKLEVVAEPVSALINDLPSKVTFDDAEVIAQIEAARAAYDALTPAQKAKVEDVEDLITLEDRLEEARVEAAKESEATVAAIANLKKGLKANGVVTTANYATFETVIAEFDALNKWEQAYVATQELSSGVVFGDVIALYRAAIATAKLYAPVAE